MPYRVYILGTPFKRDYRTKAKAAKVARRVRKNTSGMVPRPKVVFRKVKK